jgi:hypothetical protein
MNGHDEEWQLYRIVVANPPTASDFLSLAACGKRLPPATTPELILLWDGLSMYDTIGAARYTVKRRPHLGAFIATLVIPANRFRLEKTTSHPRHYTNGEHRAISCNMSSG